MQKNSISFFNSRLDDDKLELDFAHGAFHQGNKATETVGTFKSNKLC